MTGRTESPEASAATAAMAYVFTHVHVYASDPEATVSWLTEGLGGEVIGRHRYADYPEAVQVRIGALLVQIRGNRAGEHFAPAGPRTFGFDHIGLSVEDLDATLAALRVRGIEPETSFENGFRVPDGVAFVRGPDGLWVEITTLAYEPAPEDVLRAHAVAAGGVSGTP